MTHKKTKNFFGSTVTIQGDNVVTCAYGEVLKEEEEEVESGVCYKATSSNNVFRKDFGWQPHRYFKLKEWSKNREIEKHFFFLGGAREAEGRLSEMSLIYFSKS